MLSCHSIIFGVYSRGRIGKLVWLSFSLLSVTQQMLYMPKNSFLNTRFEWLSEGDGGGQDGGGILCSGYLF